MEERILDLAVENHVRYAGLSETAAERKDFLYSYLPDSSPCALLWNEKGMHTHLHTQIDHLCIRASIGKVFTNDA